MIKKKCFVWLFSLLLFLLVSARIKAQSEKEKVFQGLDLELGLGSIYDDNILKYSDYYLTKFKNHEDSGRFHVNTTDGLIIDQSVKLTPTFLFFGKNKTVLVGDFDQQTYVNNKIKNWNKISVGLQQFIVKKLSIDFSYSYLPSFYVRHYYDEDWVAIYGYAPETYQPFEFSKNEYGFWIQNTFFKNLNTRLRLSFDFEQYFYNEHFIEYDSKNLVYGINLYQPVKKKFKFELGYRFISSNAKGYDEPGETKDSSDDSDPSYNADEYNGAIKYIFQPIFKRTSNINIDFTYKRSCYTTKHYLELDRLHAGRTDDLYKLKISYEIFLLKSLTLSGFYYWCKQDSDTRAEANKELVSQEKDYLHHQYGLTFKYIFRDIRFPHSDKNK
jgi:hypothetical protein